MQVTVLRAMLTCVSATTVQMHYVVLLLIVRACYNTFIMSRSETTKQTAKAVLTQIVHIVFQRLLSGDNVPVQPISLPNLGGFGPRADQRKEMLTAQQVVLSVWDSLTQPERELSSSAVMRSDAFHPPVGADSQCVILHALAHRTLLVYY
jgi:brefeldin A-inhibited guanine nucleotide-exchange protein